MPQSQSGEVLLSLDENDDPMFGLDVIPFLASSFDQARKLWTASRPAIEKRYAAQRLKVLFAVPWLDRGPVHSPFRRPFAAIVAILVVVVVLLNMLLALSRIMNFPGQ